ncbi:glyoxalase [Luteipulveratus mongoliensis]|uniref:Glyoxalase n=1 Tax=Luteipulveratus mongoliensis TaxID=571913 RepID=A0A0K1JEY5_9MICO|nr:glyoxalase [Luteipulveratus mongoliensis]AKU15277.1 glyoxalase [Luteipulveratus mongoliensis]
MTSIAAITLDVPDATAAEAFYSGLGVGPQVRVRAASDSPTAGFRGFTMSLVVPQPSTVDHFVGAALDGGATLLKPVTKSFWGYGGSVQAPDGTIWKVATSSKKNTDPSRTDFDDLVLLLGVADVKASKKFYVERGLTVDKSYGSKYVQFEGAPNQVKLALYGRKALAKDAGVAPEGSGSHRFSVGSDAESFTDPDGFAWESVAG